MDVEESWPATMFSLETDITTAGQNLVQLSRSIAAGFQSTIGNVAAGSLFSGLQSSGAAGPALTIVNTAVQAVGAAGAAAGAVATGTYIL